MKTIGAQAREAAWSMMSITTEQKNAALLAAADNIRARCDDILTINQIEVAAAVKRGLTESFRDRMTLTVDRIEAICHALVEISTVDDPVGQTIAAWSRPNGLNIERVRVPIGVIAVIYESRPNVTVDAAAIGLKAGNAIILRGGSECIETSNTLFRAFRQALIEHELSEQAVQFIETTDREAVGALLSGLDNRVDLIIPRGGKSLVARVQQEARVAVLSHLDGICHVYLDRDADVEKAVSITVNSKMRRTGVCGAAETLLIDRAQLNKLWPPVAAALREKECELRGDATLRNLDPMVTPATLEDWQTEYLAPIISIAVVDGVEGAISHIKQYSSGHTEAIVTENSASAEQFVSSVDSAIVLHNASTQFADGGEFGLAAEIGIATGRLHARGPVGVEELTTYKNIVRGDGQIRP